MGISVGAKVIRNKELLKTIQSHHLGGIYSTANFLTKIEEGDTFFFTRHPDLSYVLKKTAPYLGKSSGLEESYTYCAIAKSYTYCAIAKSKSHLNQKKEGFINDFFWGGDAIFTNKDDMAAYKTDLAQNSKNLDWEDI
jgi:hypothetical protein